MVKGCSEETGVLQEPRARPATETGKAGFLARLEPRPEDWALRMLRSAHVLKGAGKVDWKTFTGTAKAVLDGRALWRRSPSWSMSERGPTGFWRM